MQHTFIYSLLGSILPILVYLLFIRWMDRYEREPIKNFILVFFYGAVVSSALSYAANTLVSAISAPFMTYDGHDFFIASLIAPMVEEFNKGIIIVVLLYLSKEFNSITDGLVYGAVVGLGFSFSENIMYYERIYQDSGVFEWIRSIYLRGFFLAGVHASASALFGAGCGYARTKKGVIRAIFIGVGYYMALMTHSFWNSFVTVSGIAEDNILGYVPYVGIPFIFILLFIVFEISLSEEREKIKKQLTIEAQVHQTLPLDHVSFLISFIKRNYSNWFPNNKNKKEYLQKTTELAFLLDDVEKQIIEAKDAENQINELRSAIKSLNNQSGSVVHLLLILIAVLGFFCSAAIYGLFEWRHLLMKFPAYEQAQQFIDNHPDIYNELGQIESKSSWPSGRFSYNEQRGTGFIDIKVAGSKNKGIIKLDFQNEYGRDWNIVDARIEDEEGAIKSIAIPVDYKTDAQFYVNQQQFDKAQEQCLILEKIVPTSYVTTDCWGVVAFAKGENDKYVELYRKLKEKDPEYYLYELKLGQSLLDVGLNTEAIEPLQKAWNLNPIIDVANELSAAYLNSDKLDKAVYYLDQAKAFDQKDFKHIIQFNYGIYYFKQQKYEKAITYFEDTIKLNTDYYRAYMLLSDCYYYLNQPEKVVFYLEQGLSRNPYSDDDRKYLIKYLISNNRPYEAIYHALKFDQYSANKDEAARLLQLAEDSLK